MKILMAAIAALLMEGFLFLGVAWTSNGSFPNPLYGPETGYHPLPAKNVEPAYGEETGYHAPPADVSAQGRLYATPVLAPGLSPRESTRTKGVSKKFYRVFQRSVLQPQRFYWTEFPNQIDESGGEDPPEWLILEDMYSKSIRVKPGKSDRVEMANLTRFALEQALAGTIIQWRNLDSGRRGTITVSPHHWDEAGSLCSDIQQTINFNGMTDVAYGTACRGSNDKWKIKK